MILAGIQKNSFIDYPGKISCVLFIAGCNFTCPYCHNADLARGAFPNRIESAEVIAFLKSRKGMLDGVTITGGEPTLDSGLFELCRTVKALGYALKLDTNGSRPDVLDRLLDQRLIDYVAMDIKAPVDSYSHFSRSRNMASTLMASIRSIMALAPAYEFRTTCAAPYVSPEAVKAIAETIRGAASYVLQPFNPRTECLDPKLDRHRALIGLEALQQFKTLAEPYVRHCTIR